MIRLGDVLQSAIERLGPSGVWSEVQVRKAWIAAVGPDVAAHCEVGRLRGDVLEVWVSDETWATELRYLSSAVLERLNASLGSAKVKEIVVRRSARRSP